MEVTDSKDNILLSFTGPITIHVRTFFGNFIKVVVDQNYKVVNKLFKTFIELTQNVAFYSAEKMRIENVDVGVGKFSLMTNDKFFNFNTGNRILKEHGPILKSYCEEINTLGLNGLRELKREKRKQSSVKDVGAHIGLIHVGIITENKLTYEIKEINDTISYFKIGVQIENY